jgi:DNA polymerase
MYHPAAALHQGSLRRTIEEDMRRLPEVLNELEPHAAQTEGGNSGGQQLSLL